jgi:hypothetical protein
MPVVGKADEVQDLGRAAAADPGRDGHDPQVLDGAAAGLEAVVVERRPDGARRVRKVAVADAVDRRGPAGRGHQA